MRLDIGLSDEQIRRRAQSIYSDILREHDREKKNKKPQSANARRFERR